jgi:hypothetical protein
MTKKQKTMKHRECVALVFKRTKKGTSQRVVHKQYISYKGYKEREEIIDGIKERFSSYGWKYMYMNCGTEVTVDIDLVV